MKRASIPVHKKRSEPPHPLRCPPLDCGRPGIDVALLALDTGTGRHAGRQPPRSVISRGAGRRFPMPVSDDNTSMSSMIPFGKKIKGQTIPRSHSNKKCRMWCACPAREKPKRANREPSREHTGHSENHPRSTLFACAETTPPRTSLRLRRKNS